MLYRHIYIYIYIYRHIYPIAFGLPATVPRMSTGSELAITVPDVAVAVPWWKQNSQTVGREHAKKLPNKWCKSLPKASKTEPTSIKKEVQKPSGASPGTLLGAPGAQEPTRAAKVGSWALRGPHVLGSLFDLASTLGRSGCDLCTFFEVLLLTSVLVKFLIGSGISFECFWGVF